MPADLVERSLSVTKPQNSRLGIIVPTICIWKDVKAVAALEGSPCRFQAEEMRVLI